MCLGLFSDRVAGTVRGTLAGLGYRVTRYDRMGWGYSGQRSSEHPANPTAHAEDALQLIEALRYREFDRYRPEAVQACTLVVHGDGDQIVRADTALFVQASISGSRLEWVKDAGHAIVLTRPGQLAELIDQHGAACAAA